jgi:hypothetical protein
MADEADVLVDDVHAPDASLLSGKSIAEELERRGQRPTGFPDEDVKALQRLFDAEFEADREERMRARRDAARKRRAEEEALRAARALERARREEADALAADPSASFLHGLIVSSQTPPDIAPRAATASVRALVKALASNRSVRSLDLVGCRLGDDVGRELGVALAANATLRRVDLDHNYLGPGTAAALGRALEQNGTLEMLSLEGNPLTRLGGGGVGGHAGAAPSAGGGGARAGASLASTLASSSGEGGRGGGGGGGAHGGEEPTDLSGFLHLSDALAREGCPLLRLNLFDTRIGAKGGRMLAEAVGLNTRILAVDFAPTDGIADEDAAAITAALRRNAAAAEAARAAAAAEARAAAARAKAKAEADAATAEGEAAVEWARREAEARAAAREEAMFQRVKAERLAVLDREVREKERAVKLKAEAEEKAKKEKEKGKGKKK